MQEQIDKNILTHISYKSENNEIIRAELKEGALLIYPSGSQYSKVSRGVVNREKLTDLAEKDVDSFFYKNKIIPYIENRA